jgi:hypothetical protein
MIVRNANPLAASPQAKPTLDGSAGMVLTPAPDPANPERRVLLGGALAASAVAFIPAAVAAAADANAASEAFLSISKALCGHDALNPDDALRLCNALIADDGQFASGVQALAALVERRKIDPLKLQQTLDGEHSPFAALPRKIVTAWYLGVVGEGGKARCLSFETNLSNQLVGDKLRPPSYCHGGYGSWSEKP